MRKTQLASIFILSAWLMYGCGGGSSTPPPQVATRLLVTATSSTATAGAALSITANALDSTGAVVSSYSGTVHFTSTDTQAVLPGDTPLSGGTATVQITLRTTGAQTVSASDVSKALAAGTSGSITVSAAVVLTITSGNPPGGITGSTYDPKRCTPPSGGLGNVACGGFRLFASGGVEPYTWSWTGQPGSSTPPGLDIHWGGNCPSSYIYHDWRIACTPTVAGTYNVVVTVKDSASPPNQISVNYTIIISDPPPPLINTTPEPSHGAINLPYNFQFTASGGLAPLTWSETGALPPGLNLGNDGTLSGTPTSTGSFPITMMVVDSLTRSASPQDFTIEVGEHGFKVTGSMSAGRTFHTATLLQDGKVFVAGGRNYVAANVPGGVNKTYSSTETYDPTTGSFSPTNSMQAARSAHTATLLKSGKVLIAGGFDGNSALATAEIFDPLSNSFTSTTGNMTTARSGHQATPLNDGKVLITGGSDGATALASAEIFDPDTGMFTRTGDMHTARNFHSQTTLKDGRVLVAGGEDTSSVIGTAEVFDPRSGTFSTPINMTTPRAAHAATMLNSGKVLVTGGGADTGPLASAEIFNPSDDTFTATTGSMATARNFHTATLLSDGTVLVAGGGNFQPIALAELFDPASESFTGTGSLVTARSEHTATLLNDGRVIVTGGAHITGLNTNDNKILPSAETYQ
jgi:hypothetical protein